MGGREVDSSREEFYTADYYFIAKQVEISKLVGMLVGIKMHAQNFKFTKKCAHAQILIVTTKPL